ncbi:MAG: MBL fold metallo-hydrolase [Selenomonadaceae bacterium]|nr:MBL fold metallo-hydrolase [Selenomonadaceae bacterium]
MTESKPEIELSVLGTRGSMPGEGGIFSRYGGSTSCYLVKIGKEEIYLDAGSGIADAKPANDANITLLLTHMHIDHLVGLPFFRALTEKNRRINIYGAPRAGLTPAEGIERLMSPPFWPAKICDYPAQTEIHTLPTEGEFTFPIGKVNVRMIEGQHPNGSTIFRLDYSDKSLVYATDFEHNDESSEKLIAFAQNCDLLMYDGQYTDEEYTKYKGYGHSTPSVGISIAKKCGAKSLLLVHHAPWRTDKELDSIETDLQAEYGEWISLAKIGERRFL